LSLPQPTAKSSKTHTGYLREPAVGCMGDDFQQSLDTSAPDWSDNPELGKIGVD
jgi:hypothetical protein